MKIGEKIRLLRQQKGISPERLGLLSDVSGQYIRKLEMNTRKSITLETARKLAKGLDVPVAALLDEEELKQPPTRPPQDALFDLEVSINAYIPVYGEVSAGEGIEPIDWVACTRAKVAPESYRAFRVKGLCLEPEIKDGDTLIVDTALAPQNNDLVVVLIDGQASVKKYHVALANRISEKYVPEKWLENDTGRYKPEDIKLIGVVIEFNRKQR